jgi:hypothetical protein
MPDNQLIMVDIEITPDYVVTFFFTEFGAAFTTVLPVLFKYCYKFCYSDNRKL